jgi:SAM-dependent methyltransferase
VSIVRHPLLRWDALPFHLGVANRPAYGGFPAALPFALERVEPWGLLAQRFKAETMEHLDRAYRAHSMIGSPMGDEGAGRQYAEDFLRFVLAVHPAGADLRGVRVLEIGCGTGYLLHRLQSLGAEVVGIEPGEQGQRGAERYGVRILKDLFPGEQGGTLGRFDLILHYGVLEHVPDPVPFLEAHRGFLTDAGVVALSVPDCAEHIRHGDLSMLLHEHWSYFAPHSLQRLMASAGLAPTHLRRAGFGGALYAAYRPGAAPAAEEAGGFDPDDFGRRVDAQVRAWRALLDGAKEGAVGVYCGARALNLLHLAGGAAPRFFDDDPVAQGRYYPPFPSPIESRGALLARPVEHLVIMSRSFGPRIHEALRAEPALAGTRMYLPDDLAALS